MSSLWSSFSGGITPFSSQIRYLEKPSADICPVKHSVVVLIFQTFIRHTFRVLEPHRIDMRHENSLFKSA